MEDSTGRKLDKASSFHFAFENFTSPTSRLWSMTKIHFCQRNPTWKCLTSGFPNTRWIVRVVLSASRVCFNANVSRQHGAG